MTRSSTAKYSQSKSKRANTLSEQLTDMKWHHRRLAPRLTHMQNQDPTRKKNSVGQRSLPPPETKKTIKKSSLKRTKHATRPNDDAGSSKDSMNSIQEPTIIFGTGDLLQNPDSIAHCVSSDFQISAGSAQQICNAFPALQSTLKLLKTPQVAASVSMHIPSQNKSIFNLVTKSQYFNLW